MTLDFLQNAQSTNSTVPCRISPGSENGDVLFSTYFSICESIAHDVFVLALGMLGLMAASKGLQRHGPRIVNGRILMEHNHTHLYVAVASASASAYVALILWFQIPTYGFAQYPLWGYSRLLVLVVLYPLTLYCWMRFRKFGVSSLQLCPFPAVVGTPVRATVRIPRRLQLTANATLLYKHRPPIVGRKGAHLAARDGVLGDTHGVVFQSAGATSSEASFDVWFGPNAHSTSKDGGKGYYWELVLQSSVPGVNYKAVFEVPVVPAQPNAMPGASGLQGGDGEHSEGFLPTGRGHTDDGDPKDRRLGEFGAPSSEL